MRSDRDRLDDALGAIAKINERIAEGLEVFHRDELLQVWVIHHLQMIGEASRAISQSIRDRHPEVPWKNISGLRNILVHEYFGIDMHQVWMVTQKDLPSLERQLRLIHAELA